MKRRTFVKLAAGSAAMAGTGLAGLFGAQAAGKDIVYLTPGLDLPFWRYLSKGIESVAKDKGFGYQALDSHNNPQTQLQNAQDSIAKGVAGIVISPTDSSTAPSVLQLAKQANIPVVIGDIGTNSGDYASFIISDNYEGAHGVGKALAEALKAKDWLGGTVGIVSISQARTKGFRDGLKEGGFTGKEAALQQMQSYTADETFKFVQDMLTANPDLRGLFIQTDQPAIGALRAIKAARKEGDVLVAAFDGIPDFVDLLKSKALVCSGMQQPYLMGQKSGEALVSAIGGGTPEKQILVPILVVTSDNIDQELPTVKQTVFANEV
ncbi:MAG TPA: substrate-binding domain-containing protein [Dongiaceae bacterium]|nr:substrate-binding domain-containing protein [Dongiaceae bacterium]